MSEQAPSKDQLSEQQIRFLLADAKFSIERGRALDSQLVAAWALEQLCETALAHRAAHEPPAEPVAFLKEWQAHDGMSPGKRTRVDRTPDVEHWMTDCVVTPLYPRAAQPPADDLLRKVESFLSSDRWGMIDYMEGSQIYKDLRELLVVVRSALSKAECAHLRRVGQATPEGDVIHAECQDCGTVLTKFASPE